MLDSMAGFNDNGEQKAVYQHCSSFTRRLPVSPLPAAVDSTSVYLYFDESGILLYVGITAQGILRNRQHNSDKEWWPLVARQEVEHFSTRVAAREREVELISTYRPPFNYQNNPSQAESWASYVGLSAELINDPIAIYRERGRIIQLLVVEATSVSATFVTLLGDAAVTKCLPINQERKTRVFDQHGTAIGTVTSIWSMGPQLHIKAKIRIPTTFTGAVGRLRLIDQRKPVVIELCGICVNQVGAA